MTVNLILASASPRRKELLELLQLPFEVIPSEVDEIVDERLHPSNMVQSLASQKAEYVAEKHPQSYVIGSDTLVVYDGQMLGKPQNKHEAIEMLQKLSGKTHEVYTGVTIVHGSNVVSFCEKTVVTFFSLSNKEIEGYVATGEPMDKAGSYGIQGYGSLLVEKINGDYYAVVGLPIARLKRELMNMGFYDNIVTC